MKMLLSQWPENNFSLIVVAAKAQRTCLYYYITLRSPVSALESEKRVRSVSAAVMVKPFNKRVKISHGRHTSLLCDDEGESENSSSHARTNTNIQNKDIKITVGSNFIYYVYKKRSCRGPKRACRHLAIYLAISLVLATPNTCSDKWHIIF